MPTFTSLVGANPARRTTEPEFKLGTPVLADDNTTWVYVQANGAIAAEDVVIVSAAFQASTGAGDYTAPTAFADNEYGWVTLTATPL